MLLPDLKLTPEEAHKLHWEMCHELPIWTVTAKTRDYPDKIVARMSLTMSRQITRYVLIADTHEGLREMLPRGLTLIPRDPADDAVIMECWM